VEGAGAQGAQAAEPAARAEGDAGRADGEAPARQGGAEGAKEEGARGAVRGAAAFLAAAPPLAVPAFLAAPPPLAVPAYLAAALADDGAAIEQPAALQGAVDDGYLVDLLNGAPDWSGRAGAPRFRRGGEGGASAQVAAA
jgi:hypothetical protein